jgi:hypothetical protein
MKLFKIRALPVIAVLVGMVFVPSAFSQPATIVIQNGDGPGEGFNDAGAPVVAPGNPGGTLGAQRLFAFQYAANIWAQCIQSASIVVVNAQMNPQFCNATSAVLGSAGTNFIWRDFAGAPQAATWYPDALADALFGADLNPGNPDIFAQFNSNLNGNPACLGGIGWYYGTDQNPGSDIDFISVVAHEIGHGLGFQTFQSSAGVWFGGFLDTYGTNMFHNFAIPAAYPSMTNAQRAAGNIGDPNLVWNGACVKAVANTILTAGAGGAGRARLHGPNPFQNGSSLSHWSPALTPNQLMEPFYTGANHNVALELQLLKDIGWQLVPKGPVATAITSFDARPGDRGVEISAAFHSDSDEFTVNVFRGEGEARPTTLIHGEDVSNGDPFAFTDADVTPGRGYTYQISVRDPDGEFWSEPVSVTVRLVNASLAQNVPNPFNPTTTISFTLPASQDVSLTIYDAQGKVVRNLAGGVHSHGPHSVTWDGKDNNGNAVGTGIYFYRLVSGTFTESKKMVLLK